MGAIGFVQGREETRSSCPIAYRAHGKFPGSARVEASPYPLKVAAFLIPTKLCPVTSDVRFNDVRKHNLLNFAYREGHYPLSSVFRILFRSMTASIESVGRAGRLAL